VLGAIIFGGTQFLETKRKVVMYFQGSVGGLAVGSPVNFRGVQIGNVTKITINYDIDKQTLEIPVVAEFLPSSIHVTRGKREAETTLQALLARGMRAQLGAQSLVTAQASVELAFRPDTPIRLVGGGSAELMEVRAIPWSMASKQANVWYLLNKVSHWSLAMLG